MRRLLPRWARLWLPNADPDKQEWVMWAACYGAPALMYSHKCKTECRQQRLGCNIDPDVEQLRSLCDSCPVEKDCLTWALKSKHEHGMAGGMTEGERRMLLVYMKQHPEPPRRAK